MPKKDSLTKIITLESRIITVRGQKVIVDADLAELYGTTTKRLNEQVRRNSERFPNDFMFQLTEQEKDEVVANCDHLAKLKFSRFLPNAFTEHGTIMAANVVNSPTAIEAGLYVVRAFVKMREFILENKEMALKLAELEQRVSEHDAEIGAIITTVNQMIPPKKIGKQIGFTSKEIKKRSNACPEVGPSALRSRSRWRCGRAQVALNIALRSRRATRRTARTPSGSSSCTGGCSWARRSTDWRSARAGGCGPAPCLGR